MKFLCEFYQVSRSGFYAWLNRPESRREAENRRLSRQIIKIYNQSRKIYGSPRVTKALQNSGIEANRKRIARIMRDLGLVGRARRVYWHNPRSHAFFKKTNNIRLDLPMPAQKNQIWVGDVTYIRVGNKWQYLAAVMDLYSRRIIGWALDDHRRVDLTERALLSAINKRNPDQGLIFHSDRGIEYASYRYQDILKQYGMIPSMNRPGHCQDNAHMESFFHSLKAELIRGTKIKSANELRSRIKGYIQHFYNSVRLHSSIGYVAPIQYEKMAA